MIFGKPQRRSAGIYRRGGKLFIYPYNKTTTGLSIGGEPVSVMEQTATDEEVGGAILRALSRHRTDLPHPASFEGMPEPLLDAAGVKTWAIFSKGALSCLISEDKSEIIVTPSRRAKAKGAYLHAPDLEVKLALPASDEQIGTAVREALSRCE